MIPILGVLGHVKCLLSLLLLVIGTKTYLWFFSPAHVWGINLAKDIVCPKESMLNVNRRACCAAWCLPAKVSVWAEPACPMVGARSTDSQCCDHTFLWNSCKYLQDYWNTNHQCKRSLVIQPTHGRAGSFPSMYSFVETDLMWLRRSDFSPLPLGKKSHFHGWGDLDVRIIFPVS